MSGMVLVLCIFLCGCPYESEFPLAAPETSLIDRDLIGNWQFSESKGKEKETFTIYSFNDHEFIFISVEEDKKIVAYRAYSTPIEGEKFLNVREIDQAPDRKPWHIVRYSVNKNQLVLQIVEDTLMKNEKIQTSQDLSECIRKHLKNKKLYSEGGEMIFERYVENHRP